MRDVRSVSDISTKEFQKDMIHWTRNEGKNIFLAHGWKKFNNVAGEFFLKNFRYKQL